LAFDEDRLGLALLQGRERLLMVLMFQLSRNGVLASLVAMSCFVDDIRFEVDNDPQGRQWGLLAPSKIKSEPNLVSKDPRVMSSLSFGSCQGHHFFTGPSHPPVVFFHLSQLPSSKPCGGVQVAGAEFGDGAEGATALISMDATGGVYDDSAAAEGTV
jgi:hypothetical protein